MIFVRALLLSLPSSDVIYDTKVIKIAKIHSVHARAMFRQFFYLFIFSRFEINKRIISLFALCNSFSD